MLEINLAKIVRNLPGGKKEVFPMVGTVPGEGMMPGEPGKDGQDGKDGKDGRSPYIGADGYWYQYDDAQGKYVKTNTKAQGEGSGSDGGYYTPSVATNGDLSWTASKSGMPSVSTVNIRGPQGPSGSGSDGGYYTPSVDAQGNLSWTASAEGMPAVTTVNIKGPQGIQGIPGPAGSGSGGTAGSITPSGTDDTEAIQSYINSHVSEQGCALYLPAGVYYITDTITLPANCLRFWMHGEGVIDTKSVFSSSISDGMLNALKNNMTVIVAKFTTSKPMLSLHADVLGAKIENILFLNMSGDVLTANDYIAPKTMTDAFKKKVSGVHGFDVINYMNEATGESEFNIAYAESSIKVDGIRFYKSHEITNCSFIGMSGAAVHGISGVDKNGYASRPQNAHVKDCSFFRCRTAIEIDFFDSTIKNCWTCRCFDGVRFTDMSEAASQKITGCWFDQLYGDAIWGTRGFNPLQVNDTWVDLIGGHFINVDNTKANADRKNSFFLITGCRVNRTNIVSGDASIDAFTVQGSTIIVDSQDTHTSAGTYTCKPLIKVAGDTKDNVVICSRRNKIFNTTSGVPSYGRNFVIDKDGPYDSAGGRRYVNGTFFGTAVPTTSSAAPFVGAQWWTASEMYVCTAISSSTYTWNKVAALS